MTTKAKQSGGMKLVRFARTVPTVLLTLALGVNAANPILPLWEFVPDGEPYVFEDPDNPGKMRVYLYGSHDTIRTAYCGHDYVVWSAPVEDPVNWRFDGVAFRSDRDAKGAPLLKHAFGDFLWDPDVALVTGADGKKTYYMFPFIQEGATRPVGLAARKRLGMVAKSCRPDGPFEVCNWSKNDPEKVSGIGQPLAVFVDDDGRAYAYWDGVGAELDTSTMATLKPGAKVVRLLSSCWRKGVSRYFEGPSLRKIKGKYVFIYCRRTANGEWGLPSSPYTLAYAYSDHPLGPYTYGGTLIDCRARETGPDGKTRVTAAPCGNTHGSLCEINGKWYLFYHRQTGTDEFSRQAMVAQVEISVDERPGGKVSIPEAEYNCLGFETEGLNPFESHAAGIACYYIGPTPATYKWPKCTYSGPYPEPFRCEAYGFGNDLLKSRNMNRCALVHCTDGSVAGWKYFNFDKTFGKKGLKLLVELEPIGVDGEVSVWVKRPSAQEGGIKVGSFSVTSSLPDGVQTVEVPVEALASVKGCEALYFTFSAPVKNRSICTLHTLQFK